MSLKDPCSKFIKLHFDFIAFQKLLNLSNNNVFTYHIFAKPKLFVARNETNLTDDLAEFLVTMFLILMVYLIDTYGKHVDNI